MINIKRSQLKMQFSKLQFGVGLLDPLGMTFPDKFLAEYAHWEAPLFATCILCSDPSSV